MVEPVDTSERGVLDGFEAAPSSGDQPALIQCICTSDSPTCDANELVAPIHPKAMITVLLTDNNERRLIDGYETVVRLQCPVRAIG